MAFNFDFGDLTKIEEDHILIFLSFVLILAPGALVIAVFSPELYLKLDFLKITLLAVSFTTLSSLPFSLVAYLDVYEKFRHKNAAVHVLSFSLFINGFVTAILLTIFYLFDLKFKLFLIVYVIMVVVIPIRMIVMANATGKDKKNKK